MLVTLGSYEAGPALREPVANNAKKVMASLSVLQTVLLVMLFLIVSSVCSFHRFLYQRLLKGGVSEGGELWDLVTEAMALQLEVLLPTGFLYAGHRPLGHSEGVNLSRQSVDSLAQLLRRVVQWETFL